MKYLDQALIEYAGSEDYPLHMPGHKRRFPYTIDATRMDITEINGFDDLHEPEGMIADLEQDLADFYQVPKAHFLVGGSTLGNLASILSQTKNGDGLLLARNCHKSVYHASILGRLSVDYVAAELLDYGLQGGIQPEILKDTLAQLDEQGRLPKMLVITSPSYEGMVSDVRRISEIVHDRQMLLLVDAAHGAHLGMHPAFPSSVVSQGADLVVTSLHKTLPFYTMSAALLIPEGSQANVRRVKELIDQLETSSPSYILMGQAASAVRLLQEEGEIYLKRYLASLKKFRGRMSALRYLSLFATDDLGKLVIVTAQSGISGHELMQILRERYHFALELDSFDYVLAMTSLMDEPEALQSFGDALLEIDASLGESAANAKRHRDLFSISQRVLSPAVWRRAKCMEPWEAREKGGRWIPLEESMGEVCRDFVMVYPPGIPVLASGERVDREVISYLLQALETGLNVQGLDQGKICILDREET